MSEVIKSGWKTTDWWITLGTFIITGLVLTGVVSQQNSGDAISVISHAIESIGMILAQYGIVHKYLSSRHNLKMKHAEKRTTSSKPRKISKKTAFPAPGAK